MTNYQALSITVTASASEINNLVRVSDEDFEHSNFLYNNLVDLIEQYYRLCMISYDACKYFHKRAWLLAGKKLHDEIIQFNDSKRFK